MTISLLIEQILNGLQFGVMLFLMSAGLTLVFGVMGLINLAHGSFYMIGAFAAALNCCASIPALLAVVKSISFGGVPRSLPSPFLLK